MPRPSSVRGSEFFSASYPPVIYEYPADKIFSYIPGDVNFLHRLRIDMSLLFASSVCVNRSLHAKIDPIRQKLT